MKASEYRALSEFRCQIRRFLHFSEAAARSEGLEPQQHQILLAVRGLADRQGPTVGELAEHLILRHHSVVGLIDRLEQHGLVERIRDDADRRQVRVILTPDGDSKLRRLSTVHKEELRTSGPRLVQALQAALA
jgi:DNA-binding MarR family transcriptional regulator